MFGKLKAFAGGVWLARHHPASALVLFGLGISVAASLILLHADPVGRVADRMLSNARPPLDRELPQTAGFVPYASADVQVVGGQGKELSCSIPKFVEFIAFSSVGGLASISLQMRQACAFHDYCYRHGAATYGYSQADCDYLLLEHAYRICRFVNTDAGASKCVRRARKVLMGVRVGGSDNFKRADGMPPSIAGKPKTTCPSELPKSVIARQDYLIDEDCTSSYFEFDPYPVRSNSFTVYRIADAPRQWADVHQKSLYVFEVRPAATRVTVLGWHKTTSQSYCTGFELPGGFEFLSVAPQVVKTGGAKGEDWLIWWRRNNLENTGGYLAILAPGRATIDDWARLFQGARPITPKNCEARDIAGAKSPNAKASRKILIGDKRRKPDDTKLLAGEDDDPVAGENTDPNISELHPAPGLEPDGKIRLIALRTHTCQNQEKRVPVPVRGNEKRTQPLNTICHHDITVAPEGKRLQRPEPYTVRDEINRLTGSPNPSVPRASGNDGLDPDRYRNFVTRPIALAGNSINSPVIAWLRRGEAQGQTYQQQALLRRASHVNDDGTGLPVVLLVDFDEGADPTFVLGRTTDKPSLVSLRLDPHKPHEVRIDRWEIPLSGAKPVMPNCASNGLDTPRLLRDCAQHEVSRTPIAERCAAQLDDSWLVRPPIVSARADGSADIVFSRLLSTERSANITLAIRTAQLGNSGDCILVESPPPHPVSTALVERPVATTSPGETANSDQMARWMKATTAALAELRARPVLVGALDENERYVIVPDAKNLARTTILRLK